MNTPDRWIRASDWGRIVALVGLRPAAVPADVITALEARIPTPGDQAADRTARAATTRDCRRCDDFGWRLTHDGTPVDPAVRCNHAATTPVGRDITEPIHGRDDTP